MQATESKLDRMSCFFVMDRFLGDEAKEADAASSELIRRCVRDTRHVADDDFRARLWDRASQN